METFKIDGLSKYLNTSSSTIRRLIKEGKLPYFRVGGIIKFNKVSIDNWIKEQELNNLHKKEAVYNDNKQQ